MTSLIEISYHDKNGELNSISIDSDTNLNELITLAGDILFDIGYDYDEIREAINNYNVGGENNA